MSDKTWLLTSYLARTPEQWHDYAREVSIKLDKALATIAEYEAKEKESPQEEGSHAIDLKEDEEEELDRKVKAANEKRTGQLGDGHWTDEQRKTLMKRGAKPLEFKMLTPLEPVDNLEAVPQTDQEHAFLESLKRGIDKRNAAQPGSNDQMMASHFVRFLRNKAKKNPRFKILIDSVKDDGITHKEREEARDKAFSPVNTIDEATEVTRGLSGKAIQENAEKVEKEFEEKSKEWLKDVPKMEIEGLSKAINDTSNMDELKKDLEQKKAALVEAKKATKDTFNAMKEAMRPDLSFLDTEAPEPPEWFEPIGLGEKPNIVRFPDQIEKEESAQIYDTNVDKATKNVEDIEAWEEEYELQKIVQWRWKFAKALKEAEPVSLGRKQTRENKA